MDKHERGLFKLFSIVFFTQNNSLSSIIADFNLEIRLPNLFSAVSSVMTTWTGVSKKCVREMPSSIQIAFSKFSKLFVMSPMDNVLNYNLYIFPS